MESERKWKLGEDIDRHDNLLDGISFDELILTAHCNCREITSEGVEKELDKILEIRLQDMKYHLQNNLQEIVQEAKKGRES